MKTCFVIMPFKKTGSPEHKHYRALFDNVIKPPIEAFGYEVTRADDSRKAGAITKDIIQPLASADLVIADLTELSPNVFYELGVRHALRGVGTIMILDESQSDIPFDITAYRVIKFRSDLAGIGGLSDELKSYTSLIEAGKVVDRDNLVHDWLPELPENVLSAMSGTAEADLRRSNKELRSTLRAYEERFGKIGESTTGHSAADVLAEALEEARSGILPAKLIEQAEHAAENNDLELFLEAVSSLMQVKSSKPGSMQMIKLMHLAQRFGHDKVTGAILDHAQKLFPSDTNIRLVYLQFLAHSDEPQLRLRARDEFAKDLNIDLQTNRIREGQRLSKVQLASVGIMLDTFHKDGLNNEAFEIITSLNEAQPNQSIVIRNLARAYEKLGDEEQSLYYYRLSALAPDADDTSAVWLGNTLHNNELHIDAAEAYCLSCILDPEDGTNFTHLAEEIAWGIRELEADGKEPIRKLPNELRDPKVIDMIMLGAISCGGLNAESSERLKRAAQRVERDLTEIVVEAQANGTSLSRRERLEMLRKIRQALQSDLTDPSANKQIDANREPAGKKDSSRSSVDPTADEVDP